MIKKLLYSAFVGCKDLCKSRRINLLTHIPAPPGDGDFTDRFFEALFLAKMEVQKRKQNVIKISIIPFLGLKVLLTRLYPPTKAFLGELIFLKYEIP